MTSQTPTLRLPPPPPPPKPLHLTMSLRSRPSAQFDGGDAHFEGGGVPPAATKSNSDYPAMPRWSRAESQLDGEEDEGERGGGTVRGRGGAGRAARDGVQDQDEGTSASTALDALFADPKGQGGADWDTPSYSQAFAGVEGRKLRRKQATSGSGSYKSAVGTLTPQSGGGGGGSTIKLAGKRNSIFFDPTLVNPFRPEEISTPSSSPSGTTPARSSPPKSLADEPSDEELLALAEAELAAQEAELPSFPSSASALIELPTTPSPSPPSPPPGIADELPCLDLPPIPLSALSLHAFAGETSFGELTFARGVEICIEVEDLGGGWSLGYLRDEGEEARGLVPRGFYAYIEQAEPQHPTLEASASSSSPSPPPASHSASPCPPSPAPSSPPTRSLPTPPPAVPSPPAPPPPPPSAALSPPALSPSHPPQSPSYASRSLGRNVIVSGIEFEPAVLTSPPTPGEFDERPLLAKLQGMEAEAQREMAMEREREMEMAREVRKGAADVQVQVQVQTPSKEEMREFFGPSSSSPPPAPPAESDLPTLPTSHWPPPLPSTTSSFPRASTSTTRESEDDVSARWSALVEQAEQRANRMGVGKVDLWGSSDELSDEEEMSESEEDEQRETPEPEPETPTTPQPISTPLPALSSPPTASPPPPTSSMLYRLGLGTSSLSLSEGRPPLGRQSSLSAKATARGALGRVQEWIRNGAGESGEEEKEGEARWYIESGPAWKEDTPTFTVVVHSPERQTSPGGDYTTFQLTTLFHPSPSSSSDSPPASPSTLTVSRRYSTFTRLHSTLSARYPLLSIPSLPRAAGGWGKGRFEGEFVETRRRDLERWLSRVGRHEVLRGAEEVRAFLVVEEEEAKELQCLLIPSSTSHTGTCFLSRVYHPEFNVDSSDAAELLERFERHAKGVELGGGVLAVEESVKGVREGILESSLRQQQLAHSLARLISGLALLSTSHDTVTNLGEDGMADLEAARDSEATRSRIWGLQNGSGAMSWRDGDDESLSTSKAVQATAEAISKVAKLEEDSARNDLLIIQELLRESSYPWTQQATLFEAHKLALAEHSLLSASPEEDEEALARCETVLNVTSAEIDRVDREKREDLQKVAEQYLDARIASGEEALTHLHFARSHFSPSAFSSLSQTGPRLRSSLSLAPPTSLSPLPMPSTYGVPSSIAGLGVGEAVGSVLGLGRSNSSGSRVASSGAGGYAATAGTVGRGAMEVLSSMQASTIRAPVLEEEDEEEQPSVARGTWRASFFGTARFW